MRSFDELRRLRQRASRRRHAADACGARRTEMLARVTTVARRGEDGTDHRPHLSSSRPKTIEQSDSGRDARRTRRPRAARVARRGRQQGLGDDGRAGQVLRGACSRGQVSTKNLSSAITIADYAGESAQRRRRAASSCCSCCCRCRSDSSTCCRSRFSTAGRSCSRSRNGSRAGRCPSAPTCSASRPACSLLVLLMGVALFNDLSVHVSGRRQITNYQGINLTMRFASSVSPAGCCWPLPCIAQEGAGVHGGRHPRRRPAARHRRHGLQLSTDQHRRHAVAAARARGGARAVRHRLLPRRGDAPRRQHAHRRGQRAPDHRELRDQGQQGHQDRGSAASRCATSASRRARPSIARCSRT